MSRVKKYLSLLVLLASAAMACAEQLQTLDLKPFTGCSPFDTIGAEWVLPKGRQVIDGTPFQIDGIVFMYGNYNSQRLHPPAWNSVYRFHTIRNQATPT